MRSLIAADIGDAGLEERLRNSKNALAMKSVSIAKAQLLNLFCERSLSHYRNPRASVVVPVCNAPTVVQHDQYDRYWQQYQQDEAGERKPEHQVASGKYLARA